MARFICTIFILSLYGLFTPRAVLAQSDSSPRENISVSLSARVGDSIELITLRSISLGNTRPNEGKIFINPALNSGAGLMKATGQPNGTVRITFLDEEELVNTLASHKLRFNYEVSISNRNEQSTSEIINSESQTHQMNADGEIYIWVGGSVNIRNAQPGSYRGEFTVEIEYI